MSLDEVARQAGVSTATVSRVLNNSSVVKSSTRRRVMEAIRDLKYYPNTHARDLAAGVSRTLGLIVSNLENPFFLDIFSFLEQKAEENGFELLIANTGYDAQRLRSNVHMMLGRRVAGLALVVSEIDPILLDELQERKVRTAIYDVGTPGQHTFSIKANYRSGTFQLVKYFHDLGHAKMAFIGHHTSLGPLGDRKLAFMNAMEHYAPGVEYIVETDTDDYAGGRRAVQNLFDSRFHPTAILCVNDFMAIGVLRHLRDLGLDVPKDVSVAGFDDISLSQVIHPSLTTLHIPRDHIAFEMFESLRSQHVPCDRQEVVIEPELVIRESSGPLIPKLPVIL